MRRQARRRLVEEPGRHYRSTAIDCFDIEWLDQLRTVVPDIVDQSVDRLDPQRNVVIRFEKCPQLG
jgi:hypothetical protein